MIKEIELAWLAGLIDGEGSFTVGVHKDKQRKNCLLIRPVFAITAYTGNGIWVEKVVNILAKLNINHSVATYTRDNINEPFTRIAMQGKEQIRQFSKIIFPYLIIKKQHAKLFSTFPQKRYIFVDGRVNKIKKYWKNIHQVVRYLKKSRELNRGLHSSNMKWTPEKVIDYFKNL